MPGTIVMKFGGTSVASAERLRRAAERMVAHKEAGERVVAVLSARGSTTDDLVAMAHEVSPLPDPREMDMLLSTGERISCALCAMILKDLGHQAISLTGSQAGIVTDTSHTKARIVTLKCRRHVEQRQRQHHWQLPERRVAQQQHHVLRLRGGFAFDRCRSPMTW